MVAISKEEEVQKISTSIFVTNFLDHAKAKDLWNVCKQYGQVVDAFIPDRKSKAGKRYGFVRFIRVYDVDHLVSNLCTLWMGSHHLHVNVARFIRPPAVKSGGYTHQNGKYMPKKTKDNANNGRRIDKMSYVNVVNGDTKSIEACEPALLLDESCLNQLDYSLGLLGKVKEFSSFDNMRMVLGNEGFNDIDLTYMGDTELTSTIVRYRANIGFAKRSTIYVGAFMDHDKTITERKKTRRPVEKMLPSLSHSIVTWQRTRFCYICIRAEKSAKSQPSEWYLAENGPFNLDDEGLRKGS
nr:DIE2/ALG10 family [Tanacetum cinerariifolium]